MNQVVPGDRVAVRDASGRWLAKIAVTDVEGCMAERRHDFPVVYVRWADDPRGEGIAWPADSVVPINAAPDRVLARAEYLACNGAAA